MLLPHPVESYIPEIRQLDHEQPILDVIRAEGRVPVFVVDHIEMAFRAVHIVVQDIDRNTFVGVVPLEIAFREHVRREAVCPPSGENVRVEIAIRKIEMVIYIIEVHDELLRENHRAACRYGPVLAVVTVAESVIDPSRDRTAAVGTETEAVIGGAVCAFLDLDAAYEIVAGQVLVFAVEAVGNVVAARCLDRDSGCVLPCVQYILLVGGIGDAVLPGDVSQITVVDPLRKRQLAIGFTHVASPYIPHLGGKQRIYAGISNRSVYPRFV